MPQGGVAPAGNAFDATVGVGGDVEPRAHEEATQKLTAERMPGLAPIDGVGLRDMPDRVVRPADERFEPAVGVARDARRADDLAAERVPTAPRAPDRCLPIVIERVVG